MKKYNWSDLIQYFERNNYIHNGLTIPFLIGAIKYLEGKTLTIPQIVTEFTDLNGERRTTILKCGNIGEFVIGLMDIESETYYKKFPKSLFKEFSNLTVIDNSLSNYNSISELIAFFEEQYNQAIEKEKFSLNAGKWTDFTSIELEHIDSFKNNSI
jgi:hypothetical protein